MHLKIGVIYESTAASRCALDRVCPKRGPNVDAAILVCKALKYNCTFSWYPSGDFGDVDDNGVSSGFIKAIETGEFDTSTPDFTPTFRRYKAITFSVFYGVSDVMLMTRAPSFRDADDEFNWGILFAFQWPVLLSLFISLCIMTCLMYCISVVLFPIKHRLHPGPALDKFLTLFHALMTNDFSSSHLEFVSLRLAVTGWLFGTLVMMRSYRSDLFFQTVSYEHHLPYTDLDTFVQCLERGECRLIMPSVSVSYYQHLANPNRTIGARILEATKRNPVIITERDKIPKTILDNKKQYLVNIGLKEKRLSWIKENRGCAYYTLDLGLIEFQTFPMAKRSPHLQRLNQVVLTMREMGIETALRHNYNIGNLCEEDWKDKKQRRSSRDPYTLTSVTCAMMLYILNIFISIFIFCIEWLTYVFCHRSKLESSTRG